MDQDAKRRLAQLFRTGGGIQKMVRQKLAFEVKHKNRHVLAFPPSIFDTASCKLRGISCESSRDSPNCPRCYVWTKTRPKKTSVLRVFLLFLGVCGNKRETPISSECFLFHELAEHTCDHRFLANMTTARL